MFKHILVPTDGSQFSQNAVRQAVIFAKETGAQITAFYAKPSPPIPYYGEGIGYNFEMPSKYNELVEKQAQESLGFVETLCRQRGVQLAPNSNRAATFHAKRSSKPRRSANAT